MKLNEGALGKSNMFDLDHRTCASRRNPGATASRTPLSSDSEFGAEINSPQFALHKFAFPFSGEEWDVLPIGLTDRSASALLLLTGAVVVAVAAPDLEAGAAAESRSPASTSCRKPSAA